jgi:PilZ domain-containing protein
MRRPVSSSYSGTLRNIAVELQDVGWGGVRFVANEPVQPSGTLALMIREETSGEVLHARGEVAWVRTQKMEDREVHVVGVKFDQILAPPSKCARFFGEDAKPEPQARDVPSAKPPRKRRAGGRFPVSDCEVVLERDHRFRAPKTPGNLASGLLDLSRSGAQVVCSQPLSRGDRVRLTVILKKFQDIFTAEAETVWVRTFRPIENRSWKVGLAFSTLDHSQERKIESLEKWFGHASSKDRNPEP